ncbi:MAG: hypothetical protein R3Y55_03820 [Rikenellaceae bacterium]
MEENKKTICDLLLVTLQNTRGGQNLTALDYDEAQDVVLAAFANGRTKCCNVGGSSGTATICDIIHQLDL